jgi:hypothetical protein
MIDIREDAIEKDRGNSHTCADLTELLVSILRGEGEERY